MRKALITLGISAVLLGLIIYIGLTISPYDNVKLTEIASVLGVSDPVELTDNIDNLIGFGLIYPLINSGTFYAVLALGLCFTVSFVAAIHMLIDKLFYKRFYEEPRMWPAIRRGILIYTVFIGLLFFRLLGGLTWQNAILVVILGIVIEFLFLRFEK